MLFFWMVGSFDPLISDSSSVTKCDQMTCFSFLQSSSSFLLPWPPLFNICKIPQYNHFYAAGQEWRLYSKLSSPGRSARWFIWALAELLFCSISFLFSLTVGYVFFPDGKKAGIEWSNASLAEMADDGVIKDEYRVSFTAGKWHIYLKICLDQSSFSIYKAKRKTTALWKSIRKNLYAKIVDVVNFWD